MLSVLFTAARVIDQIWPICLYNDCKRCNAQNIPLKKKKLYTYEAMT